MRQTRLNQQGRIIIRENTHRNGTRQPNLLNRRILCGQKQLGLGRLSRLSVAPNLNLGRRGRHLNRNVILRPNGGDLQLRCLPGAHTQRQSGLRGHLDRRASRAGLAREQRPGNFLAGGLVHNLHTFSLRGVRMGHPNRTKRRATIPDRSISCGKGSRSGDVLNLCRCFGRVCLLFGFARLRLRLNRSFKF